MREIFYPIIIAVIRFGSSQLTDNGQPRVTVGHPNTSAMLDLAILGNKTKYTITESSSDIDDGFDRSSDRVVSVIDSEHGGTKHRTESVSQASSYSLPVTRSSRSFYTPGHIPLVYQDVTSARQATYPERNEILDASRSTLDKRDSQTAEYNGIDHVQRREEFSELPANTLRRRKDGRKKIRISRDDLNSDPATDSYVDDTYGPLASSGSHYSSPTYESDPIDAYPTGYSSSSKSHYGPANYNSLPSENYNDGRFHENIAHYSNVEQFPFRQSYAQGPSSQYVSQSVYTVPDQTPSLLAIFSAIGGNLLQLLKIGLGSGLTVIIPLLILKIFLIPLKIFKFLKLVKILFKVFFVIPFILRVFAPSIASAIGIHKIGSGGFGNKMEPAMITESRTDIDENSENFSWWNHTNASSTSLGDVFGAQQCSSKVACELGSYLASKNNLSRKMTTFLATVEEASIGPGGNHTERLDETNVFLDALTQPWSHDQCDTFRCSIKL